ncbi:MAG: hypothetical protein PHU88_07485 [candidate division Zixibacteria bacterium]|nr:hypothetical protein [candidate division Zixibacteria bacterium]MDD5426443.1 hypothetical protein [candidate division Zixibacteria bacterium]
MRQMLKTVIEKVLVVPSIKLARLWPVLPLVALVRLLNGIQMSPRQLHHIMKTITGKSPCRLLVFGVGNDSIFWSLINRGGKTLFLEDNPVWFEKITGRSPGITACLVDYATRRKDWKELLETPARLEFSLPPMVGGQDWDIIVVDAPAGYDDNTPGRMKSIYMASKLVKKSGDVFVHDCNREIEDIYCNNFLGKDNLEREIKARIGNLRHYHFAGN